MKDGEEEGEERGMEGRRENGEVKWQEKSREDRSREPQRRERWARSSYGETLLSPCESNGRQYDKHDGEEDEGFPHDGLLSK